MPRSAHSADVTSIPAIREFRVALIRFQEESRSSLELLQIEIQRVLQWIEHDRPAYWTKQMRRAFDLVAQTRTALSTCQMRTVAGRRPSCIEEKQAYSAAKRRLQHCQEQVRRVKQWGVKLHQERDDFRGRMSAFSRVLEQNVPAMTALLERISATLEDYAEMTNPDDDEQSGPGSGSRPAPESHDRAGKTGKEETP